MLSSQPGMLDNRRQRTGLVFLLLLVPTLFRFNFDRYEGFLILGLTKHNVPFPSL